MIKIFTLVGARPQFIKAAAVSRIIKDEFSNLFNETIIHTGQHYDKKMSEFFFDELDIPHPNYHMNISSQSSLIMTSSSNEINAALSNKSLIVSPNPLLIE